MDSIPMKIHALGRNIQDCGMKLHVAPLHDPLDCAQQRGSLRAVCVQCYQMSDAGRTPQICAVAVPQGPPEKGDVQCEQAMRSP